MQPTGSGVGGAPVSAASWRDILGSRGSHQGVFRAPLAWRGDPAGPGTSLDVLTARSRRVGGPHPEERSAPCPRQSRGWPLSSPQEAAAEQGDRVEPGSGGCVPCAQRVLAPGGGAVSVLRQRGQQRSQLGQTRSEGHCRAGHDSLGAQCVQAPGSPGRTGGQQTRQWGSTRSQRSTDTPGCRCLSHLKDCPHHLPLRPLPPLCHPHLRPTKATSRVHTQTSWGQRKEARRGSSCPNSPMEEAVSDSPLHRRAQSTAHTSSLLRNTVETRFSVTRNDFL